MVCDDEQATATLFPGLELDASDSKSQKDVNIGPIDLDGFVYCHQGPSYVISVQDQPQKVSNGTPEPAFYDGLQLSDCVPLPSFMSQGLSFQVWPSSLTLLRYLDHQPNIWQVCPSRGGSHRLSFVH